MAKFPAYFFKETRRGFFHQQGERAGILAARKAVNDARRMALVTTHIKRALKVNCRLFFIRVIGAFARSTAALHPPTFSKMIICFETAVKNDTWLERKASL